MGFAKYFNRDVIALNKRLSTTTDKSFREILQNQIICLEFDEQIFESLEADVCIELLVRIVSRFYPKLKFSSNIKGETAHILRLKELARSINSNIEFANEDETPTFVIIASRNPGESNRLPHLFLGSEGWIARLSQTKPLLFGNSNNPFGASITACIAASNIFRFVFEKQLKLPLDAEVEFSVHNFSRDLNPDTLLDHVNLEDVNLVGIGAIGSATVWVLSRLKKLTGNISLIDHDHVEESNLQRYVLLDEKDIGSWKVDIALRAINRDHLNVNSLKCDWSEFINDIHNGRCTSRLVAVCIDSKEGRIHVQSSLPKKIINAYTDESRFGISRHEDFTSGPCLACLYMPSNIQRSKLDIMVQELNMKGHEILVYQYMKSGKLLDETFLNIFCGKNGFQLSDLQEYTNKSLGDFYIEMVCGYKMIEMQSDQQRAEHVDVPLSFQSTMAGVMLGAEIVLESLGISRREVRDVSQWQVLDQVSPDNPSHYSYLKNHSGLCICGDQDYQEVYKSKNWNRSTTQ